MSKAKIQFFKKNKKIDKTKLKKKKAQVNNLGKGKGRHTNTAEIKQRVL